MKLKPIEDRVLIEPMKADKITQGGIVLPETTEKPRARGQVVAIGSGRTLDDGSKAAMTIKVGDEILYPAHVGTELELDGAKLKILFEREVYAVVGK